MKLIPHSLTAVRFGRGIRGLIGVGRLSAPVPSQSPTSTVGSRQRCPQRHFGENQLSPGSLGISPLPTGHPIHLQLKKVRASTELYFRFTLPMGSSPGFGSTSCDSLRPVQTRFRSGFGTECLNLATKRNSPVHSSIGTRSASKRLSLLESTRFQELFHSPPGVLFTFPSRYWSAIGHFEYLALGSGLPSFPRAFTVSRGTQAHGQQARRMSATGLSPSLAARSRGLRLSARLITAVAPPSVQTPCPTTPAQLRRGLH